MKSIFQRIMAPKKPQQAKPGPTQRGHDYHRSMEKMRAMPAALGLPPK